MFRKKTNEELSRQLDRVGSVIGESIEPPFDKRERLFHKSSEELSNFFPKRYNLYTEILRDGKNLDKERREEIQSTLRALNNLDFYIANHRTGNEQDRILRARQFTVFEDLRDYFEDGKTRGYVKLPTGVGKTVLFLELVKALRQKTLIVVPTNQLVDQTLEKLKEFASELDVGRVDKVAKHFGNDVTVITYQSLVLGIKNGTLDPGMFQYVILDEAHRALGEETQKVLSGPAFTHTTMLGFSATPKFTEGKQVSQLLLPDEIHAMNIQEAVEEGLLAGFHVILARTHIDLSKLKVTTSGEYNEKELDKAINTLARNRSAVDLYKKAFIGQKFVAYCNSIAHAQQVAEEFKKQGFNVAAIHGEQNPDEQQEILEKLHRGELVGVTNAKILVEGWDEPTVKVCLNLRPTQSLVDAEQRGGRVLRLYNGLRATIVDFIDDSDIGNFPITFVEVANASVIPPDKNDSVKQRQVGEGEFGVFDWTDIKIEGLDLLSDSEQILVYVKEKTNAKYQLAPHDWFSLNDLSELANRRVAMVRTWIHAVLMSRKNALHNQFFKTFCNPKTNSLEWYVDPDLADEAFEYGKKIEQANLRVRNSPPENWIMLQQLEEELGSPGKSTYLQLRNQFLDHVGRFEDEKERKRVYLSPTFVEHIHKVLKGELKSKQQIRAEEMEAQRNARIRNHQEYLDALLGVLMSTFNIDAATAKTAFDKVKFDLATALIVNVKIVDSSSILIEAELTSRNKKISIKKESSRQLNRPRYQAALQEAGDNGRVDASLFMEERPAIVIKTS